MGFLNPINELNHWLDRKNPASKAYAAPGWHAFALTAGWWRAAETGREVLSTGFFGFDGQIIHVPEYGRPGEVRKTVRTASLTDLTFEGAFGRRPEGEDDLSNGFAEDIYLFARVVGRAWYRQKIDALGRGYAWVGSVSVHLFTLGAMGLIVPAMIVRISRGHTGRKCHPGACGA